MFARKLHFLMIAKSIPIRNEVLSLKRFCMNIKIYCALQKKKLLRTGGFFLWCRDYVTMDLRKI